MKKTQNNVTTLEADDTQQLCWSIDTAFAVHHNYKSHTDATFSMGSGCVLSASLKQKVKSRSLTKADLVALDNVILKVLWTLLFVQVQGFEVSANIIYCDNTSTMKLEQNGKASSGKRTRHCNIKYFYITDLVERGLIKLIHCPMDSLMANSMSKPTVGTKFHKFWKVILNM